MNLEESLSRGFNYTGRLFSRAADLLILTILTIIPIVNIFTLGYIGRVTRDGPDSQGPPRLEKWGSMFVDGLKVIGAALLWAIPIIIIASVLVLVLILPTIGLLRLMSPDLWMGFANSTVGNWTHLGQFMQRAFDPVRPLFLALFPAILLVAIVVLFTWVVAFTGIVHMFKKRSFTKAFAVREIFAIMGKIGYLRYLALIAIMLILGGIISLISMIPILGWIIGGFLSLLLYVSIFRSIGLLYDDAMGIGAVPVTMAMPPTAPEATPPVVAAAPVPPPEPVKGAKAKQLYCISCGSANPAEAKFCRNCGKELAKS